MLDLMSGPNAPVATACAMAGWRVVSIDCLIDEASNLADASCQAKVLAQAMAADFIWYAPDCSTKSAARLKKGYFADGAPLPPPSQVREVPFGAPRPRRG